MALTEIIDIQIKAEGENYIYEVLADEGCSGKIRIFLSSMYSTEESYRVEGVSFWGNESGTFTVKKSTIEGLSDLYLYLMDEDTQTTGTIVKVYFEPCEIQDWKITKQMELICYTDWGKSAREFSDGIVVHFIDKHGMDKYIYKPFNESRIPLEDLEISKEVDYIKLEVAYYSCRDNITVCSAYSNWFTVVIAPMNVKRAIYAKMQENKCFYISCDDPETYDFTQDIVLNLSVALTEGCAYQGSYFSLQSMEGQTLLTIKKEIYSAASEEVKNDYALLMKQIDGQNAVIEAVGRMIRERMPLEKENMLFYHYTFEPDKGRVDIMEGMSLLTEYTLYQNVPNTKQSTMDLNGYVGTGTARYAVVKRAGKLVVDSFVSGINMQVEPPKAIASDNRLCGGAGVVDLLYNGFSAEHMKLVYPVKFIERNSTGDLCYDKNICLISASSRQKLTEAADNMRKNTLSMDGVAYHYFRGRSVVIPQILITLLGSPVWVSVGTTLADVCKMLGKNSCRLYRHIEGELAVVVNPESTISLLAGDYIE